MLAHTPVTLPRLISIAEEDGLLHCPRLVLVVVCQPVPDFPPLPVVYKDLEANAIIDDLILFPGDATFAKASDRVHVLKFTSSSARSFFWHQDPSPDQDDERARKVNELIGGQVEESSEAMEVEG
jgi:26S proteasome regulatory subunit N13